MFGTGLFQEVILRYDQCRHELLLLGHYNNLVHKPVHTELRFEHLRSNKLAVAGLKEILDTFGKEELFTFHIASISRVEPSLLVDSQGCHLCLAVISLCDGITLEQYLIVVTEFQLHSVEQTTHRAHRNGLVPSVQSDGGRGLCHAISYHQLNTRGTDKLLHLWRDGSSCRRKEIMTLKS